MDKSFIVECFMEREGKIKPALGVLFHNSTPSKELLHNLGLKDISGVSEVAPLSRYPQKPTLYLFERGSRQLEIIEFDWEGKPGNRANSPGDPCQLIPPVSGPAADRLLYITKAYVISACMRDDSRTSVPIVAVLFIKSCPGKPILADKKTIDRLGLVNIQSIDEVVPKDRAMVRFQPESEIVQSPEEQARLQLFLFQRSPAASKVTIRELNQGFNVVYETTKDGEPHTIIPQISGSAADRFVNPRGSLAPSDFPKKGSTPPPRISTQPPQAFDPRAGRHPSKPPRNRV